MKKVLVLEDESSIRGFIVINLERAGYEVVEAETGEEALEKLAANPDTRAVLLDIMLPGIDGIEVCRRIRLSDPHIGVIMLSARSQEMDKVTGLMTGADDYITKPFEGKELVARVKAVLRRASPGESEKDTLSFPGLTISLEKYEVHYQGKLLEMPPKELEVLYFLASHQNRVFTREQLLEQVWGFDFFGDSRTVDVHIKRLREKLQDSEALGWTIRTVWGVGYKFEVK